MKPSSLSETLEALMDRSPLLRSPGGLALLGGGVLLALVGLVWALIWLYAAAPVWGVAAAVALLWLRAALERLTEDADPSAALGAALVAITLEGAFLLSILGGDFDFLPEILAWPVALYLAGTGALMVARTWLPPAFLGGPPRGAGEGGAYDLVRHPCLAGLARVALGFGFASGGAMGLLLALLYRVIAIGGRVHHDDQHRLAAEGTRRCHLPPLTPEGLRGEVRLLVALLEPDGDGTPGAQRSKRGTPEKPDAADEIAGVHAAPLASAGRATPPSRVAGDAPPTDAPKNPDAVEEIAAAPGVPAVEAAADGIASSPESVAPVAPLSAATQSAITALVPTFRVLKKLPARMLETICAQHGANAADVCVGMGLAPVPVGGMYCPVTPVAPAPAP